jgi:hypothetical protein
MGREMLVIDTPMVETAVERPGLAMCLQGDLSYPECSVFREGLS